MDLSLRGAFQGYIWYFNSLYRSEVGWTFWIVLICLGIGISLWLRSSWSLFFIGYIVLTLLPVVFLTNHRASFYWYIPALGLSGLIGMTAGAISAWIRSRIPCFAAGLAGLVIFAGLCLAHYEHQKSLSFFDRSWLAELSTEYQSFVEELRLLPEPGPGEILYYQSVPRYFDEVVATAAVRVALRRPDLYARIVSSFPSESLCRLRFDNNRLIRESVP